jgi:hypothetical protein
MNENLMMNITLDSTTLRDMAHRLTEELNTKKAYINGKPIGFNRTLNMLSVSLTDMPYEKLKLSLDAGLSGNATEYNSMAAPRVIILSYKSEHILCLDGHYVNATRTGSNVEIPYDSLLAQANTLASIRQTRVAKYALPEVLDEDWGVEDAISLAKSLRLFDESQPLYVSMYEGASYMFDGILCQYGPDEDTVFDIDDRPFENIIWHPEYSHDYIKYEHFITLNDIINAVRLDDNRWRLFLDGKEVVVRIFNP